MPQAQSSMQSIRKPRVFLSHSKKDVAFVRRLESDLRSCQCEPWIDEVELRHGRPWLDQIFAAGIPSCEVVLCYITDNSIQSEMVQQEINARLIERLQNDRVSLLVYVARSELRSKLRLDLQSLQIPELNDENYAQVFPRVVAEIWRSYAEHSSASAAQSERVKRLEAELRIRELEQSASAGVFSASEEAEFQIIWSRLNHELALQAKVKSRPPNSPGGPLVVSVDEQRSIRAFEAKFWVSVGSLFRSEVARQKFQPSEQAIDRRIEKELLESLDLAPDEYQVSFNFPVDIEAELLRCGFVDRHSIPPHPSPSRITSFVGAKFRLLFTPKFDRFCFWLEYKFGQDESLKIVRVESGT